jgi:methionyl-tRNA synthetase
MSEYRFNEALGFIWKKITDADHFLDQEKPWELLKSPTTENTQRLHSALEHLVGRIQEISALLEPFMPETSRKIEEQFNGPKVISTTPLFPRL